MEVVDLGKSESVLHVVPLLERKAAADDVEEKELCLEFDS